MGGPSAGCLGCSTARGQRQGQEGHVPRWGSRAAIMSPRMSSLLDLQRILGTSDLQLALLASPGRREALRAVSLGQSGWWQWAVLALYPGNWGLLLEAKSQR